MMRLDKKLPRAPRLEHFKGQARELVRAFSAEAPEAKRWVRRYHPRLSGRPDTNERNDVTESALRKLRLSLADGQFIVARVHQFDNWAQFAKHIVALNEPGSKVWRFEAA